MGQPLIDPIVKPENPTPGQCRAFRVELNVLFLHKTPCQVEGRNGAGVVQAAGVDEGFKTGEGNAVGLDGVVFVAFQPGRAQVSGEEGVGLHGQVFGKGSEFGQEVEAGGFEANFFLEFAVGCVGVGLAGFGFSGRQEQGGVCKGGRRFSDEDDVVIFIQRDDHDGVACADVFGAVGVEMERKILPLVECMVCHRYRLLSYCLEVEVFEQILNDVGGKLM